LKIAPEALGRFSEKFSPPTDAVATPLQAKLGGWSPALSVGETQGAKRHGVNTW
jgi:hypothetical protein